MNEPLYSSKDLALSSYLLARGAVFRGLYSRNGYFLFQFADPDRCKGFEDEFWAGAKVRVLDFVNSQRTLKTLLFKEKDKV